MHFWSPNKKPTGGGGERKEKKRKKKKGKEKEQAKVWKLNLSMDACLWYGTCDFYMELYGFVWISCLIVWLGACSKPRVVRITS